MYMSFFGYEKAIDELLIIGQQAEGINVCLSAELKGTAKSILKVMSIINTCVSIFTAPMNIHSGYIAYHNAYTHHIQAHHKPLALPKPVDPQSELLGSTPTQV